MVCSDSFENPASKMASAPFGGAAAKPSASMLRRRRRQRACHGSDKVSQSGSDQTGHSGSDKARNELVKPAGVRRQSEAQQISGGQWVTPMPGATLSLSRTDVAAALGACDATRSATIAAFKRHMQTLSFDPSGCHLVQELLQNADCREVQSLVAELHGCARDAIRSPYANYVLQKIIEVLPIKHSVFIMEELRGAGAQLACHRYGCRIFCRLLEHASPHAEPASLIDEVLEETDAICRHTFGHYVVQAVLEHGLPRQRHEVAKTLSCDVKGYATNRHACYVLEDCFAYCCNEDKQMLVEAFLRLELGELVRLAQDIYGSYVLRALLQLPADSLEGGPRKLGDALLQVAPLLQASKYSRRVLEELRAAAR